MTDLSIFFESLLFAVISGHRSTIVGTYNVYRVPNIGKTLSMYKDMNKLQKEFKDNESKSL